MSKIIKLRSKFLNVLNESLQKMSIEQSIKVIKNPFMEADGNFTSVIQTNSSFNPSDINSNIMVNEEPLEDKSEEKAELVKKATQTIKQTLDVTDELQSLLNRIKKLNAENNADDWKINEEGNTAILKNKNARIFKQNENICLSHNGEVEIFKTVQELHDWLKKNNYPMPKNIKLHEATEDTRNFLSNFCYYLYNNSITRDPKSVLDKVMILFKDKNPSYEYDPLYHALKSINNRKTYSFNDITKVIREFDNIYASNDLNPENIENTVNEILKVNEDKYDKKYGPSLSKYFANYHKQTSDGRTIGDREPINWEEINKNKQKYLQKPIVKMNKDMYRDITRSMSNKEMFGQKESINEAEGFWYLLYEDINHDQNLYLNDAWREGNLLTNSINEAAAFMTEEDALNEANEVYNTMSTEYPFKPFQDINISECFGATTGTLGSAVQYLGNKKDESLNEEQELEEVRIPQEEIDRRNKLFPELNGNVKSARDILKFYGKDNYANLTDEQKQALADLRTNEYLNDYGHYIFNNTKDRPDKWLMSGTNNWTRYIIKGSNLLNNKEEFIKNLNDFINTSPEKFNFTAEDLVNNTDNTVNLKDPRYQDKAFKNYFKNALKNHQFFNNDMSLADYLNSKNRTAKLDNSYKGDLDARRALVRDDIAQGKKAATFAMNKTMNSAIALGINPLTAKYQKALDNQFKELNPNGPQLLSILQDIQNDESLSTELKYDLAVQLRDKINTVDENERDVLTDWGQKLDTDSLADINDIIFEITDEMDLDNDVEAGLPEFKLPKEESSLYDAFMAEENKKEPLKEDDSPADFATGFNASMDSSKFVGSDASQTSSQSTETTSNIETPNNNVSVDNGTPDMSFGDININSDYSPEEKDEEQPQIPTQNMPEYRIIDVLVNDKDETDIKVKLQDTKTGKTEIKNLYEIDV